MDLYLIKPKLVTKFHIRIAALVVLARDLGDDESVIYSGKLLLYITNNNNMIDYIIIRMSASSL